MYDIAILGGGPGGYVAAIRGAQLGGKIALIEKDVVGGTCLNRGCIPTKAMLASASIYSRIKEAESFGIEVGSVSVSLEKIIERKNGIVRQLTGGIDKLLEHHGVEVIRGTGVLKDRNTFSVTSADGATQEVSAKNLIIATGSEAATIASLGYDGVNVMTSTELLNLKEQPKSLVIIGAGVIGCEFASVFHELGTEVTIVEAMDRVLPMVDEEVSKRFAMLLKKKKIAVHTSVMVESVTKGEAGMVLKLSGDKELVAEKVLIGIGRSLNSKGLGLEEVGIALGQRGEIITDETMKTNVDHIYAIGDVNNKVLLAHAASAQGQTVVENILKGKQDAADVQFVPNAIYTFPEIASIGITEKAAAERGEIKVGKFPFTACGKALCIGEKDGFVKIIADAKTDEILGVHIIGPHATDLIAEAVLAIRNGLTVEDIAKSIHAHPTISESVMEAAEAVHGLAIHSI